MMHWSSKRRLAVPALAVLALSAGCRDAAGPRFEPIDLAGPWPTATPAEVGIDAAALDAALAYGGTVEGLNGVVVVKDGYLVAERHYAALPADSPRDGRSVTKSVIGTLVGIVADQGLLSLDQTLEDWLPDYELDAAHRAITIRHLLTMTSGIAWNDDEDYNPWVRSGEPVRFVLDLPVVAPPGERFIYNSGTVHFLSIILSRATGSDAALLAQEHLFDPLGIAWEDWFWRVWPDGTPNGAADLGMRLTDWARIGQLYLQGGRSGERQVIPEAWVKAATARQVSLGDIGTLSDAGYGYLWWRDDDVPHGPAWIAWGYGGQYIYIVPGSNLVVVTTAVWRGVGATHGQHEYDIMQFIRNRLLPAAG